MPNISFIRIFTIIFFLSGCFLPAATLAETTSMTPVAGISLEELQKTGYRIDWMNQSNSKGLHLPTIIGDSLYVVDSDDYLIRYDRRTGQWLWSTPVGNKVFKLHGITEFSSQNRVLVLSDGAVYVVEKATGNYPSSSGNTNAAFSGDKRMLPLKWTANTPSVITDGTFLIYGSNGGDLVWFNPAIGFDVQRYNIGSSVGSPPALVHGIRNNTNENKRSAVIASSKEGNVSAVDVKSASGLWNLQLTSPVTAKVAYGTNTSTLYDEDFERTSIFIAGTDQYIRAVDLHTGKRRWNILTSAPLTDSPFFLNDQIYQRIPQKGLASYVAFPGSLSGEQSWLASDVRGTPITTTKDGKLVCWDQNKRLLQIVDPRKGGIVSSLSIPTAKIVLADSPKNGSLQILTNDELLFRLVPRH